MTDKELFHEVNEVHRKYLRRLKRRALLVSAGAPLLSGLAIAMFGNVIGYGFAHDVPQLIAVGITGAVATIGAWWCYLVR